MLWLMGKRKKGRREERETNSFTGPCVYLMLSGYFLLMERHSWDAVAFAWVGEKSGKYIENTNET